MIWQSCDSCPVSTTKYIPSDCPISTPKYIPSMHAPFPGKKCRAISGLQ
ncbi:hypothetical protein CIPAW_13G005900 [Carya illinoinensis]|uniref:Uncharacterized protein n=1 Tax=Carya illinoinensis TaxID=32201 RepID=A0A8T1NKN0_CARIL|nr:hypothetical protein CIPAW_13G005900 [Carya illinoinensis]